MRTLNVFYIDFLLSEQLQSAEYDYKGLINVLKLRYYKH